MDRQEQTAEKSTFKQIKNSNLQLQVLPWSKAQETVAYCER